MENKNFIKEQLDLTIKLLGVVNSKEEYEYLLSEGERLTSLIYFLTSHTRTDFRIERKKRYEAV